MKSKVGGLFSCSRHVGVPYWRFQVIVLQPESWSGHIQPLGAFSKAHVFLWHHSLSKNHGGDTFAQGEFIGPHGYFIIAVRWIIPQTSQSQTVSPLPPTAVSRICWRRCTWRQLWRQVHQLLGTVLLPLVENQTWLAGKSMNKGVNRKITSKYLGYFPLPCVITGGYLGCHHQKSRTSTTSTVARWSITVASATSELQWKRTTIK